MDASELLKDAGIVPVVVLDDADVAPAIAGCLFDAGLTAIEITLRTPQALDAIAAVASQYPEALVGAGSVRTVLQMGAVRNAGARFAVSPGHSDALIDAASDVGMPFVPGAVTASEVLYLQERGYSLIKFFPAELAGGTAMLKALGAPLPEARFFPTGGITPALARDYLDLANVACIGGSWITPADRIAANDLEGISRLAKDAAGLVP